MTPEQITALLLALGTVLGAVALVLQRIAELRRDLNGRLQELIETASAAAHKDGELVGRDFMHRRLTAADEETASSSELPAVAVQSSESSSSSSS